MLAHGSSSHAAFEKHADVRTQLASEWRGTLVDDDDDDDDHLSPRRSTNDWEGRRFGDKRVVNCALARDDGSAGLGAKG